MTRWSYALLLATPLLTGAEKPAKPPLDAAVPAKLETATFAVG